MKKRQPRGI